MLWQVCGDQNWFFLSVVEVPGIGASAFSLSHLVSIYFYSCYFVLVIIN